MSPVKSQILGLLLGLSTAVSCIFYEKMVINFSYITILILWLLEEILLFVTGFIIFENNVKADYYKFISDSKYWIWVLIYVCTAITSLLWYKITKNQGVITTCIYEMKYIIILACIYFFLGDKKFTLNMAIGVVFAICSIYFISKS